MRDLLRRTLAVGPLFGLIVACSDGTTQPPAMVTLSVASTGTGSGFVSSDPTGIYCELGFAVLPETPAKTCTHAFPRGTQVTLTVTAGANTSFGGWTGGGCTGTESCVFTIQEATTISLELELLPDHPGLGISVR